MRASRFDRGLVVIPAVALLFGCDSGTEVQLAEAPPYTPPPAKRIEDMTKKERQRLGGTAGLKFDASGNRIKE